MPPKAKGKGKAKAKAKGAAEPEEEVFKEPTPEEIEAARVAEKTDAINKKLDEVRQKFMNPDLKKAMDEAMKLVAITGEEMDDLTPESQCIKNEADAEALLAEPLKAAEEAGMLGQEKQAMERWKCANQIKVSFDALNSVFDGKDTDAMQKAITEARKVEEERTTLALRTFALVQKINATTTRRAEVVAERQNLGAATSFGEVKEEAAIRVAECVGEIMKVDATYKAKDVARWTEDLTVAALNKLTGMNNKLKYVVNISILENKNQPEMHTMTSCFWDSETDGAIDYKWENKEKTMYVIVQAFGLGKPKPEGEEKKA